MTARKNKWRETLPIVALALFGLVWMVPLIWTLLTAFVRDRVRWRNVVLDLGLRLDRYSMLVVDSELQPRVGLAYHIESTGTVLRASYNRNFQTPPNENLLLANSQQAALLAPPAVRRSLNGGSIPIQPQYQNVYETGLQQSIGGVVSVDAAFYHKNSTNPQDNDNFLDTGIIFPTSLAFSRVNGVDARIVLPERRGVSGSRRVRITRLEPLAKRKPGESTGISSDRQASYRFPSTSTGSHERERGNVH